MVENEQLEVVESEGDGWMRVCTSCVFYITVAVQYLQQQYRSSCVMATDSCPQSLYTAVVSAVL